MIININFYDLRKLLYLCKISSLIKKKGWLNHPFFYTSSNTPSSGSNRTRSSPILVKRNNECLSADSRIRAWPRNKMISSTSSGDQYRTSPLLVKMIPTSCTASASCKIATDSQFCLGHRIDRLSL